MASEVVGNKFTWIIKDLSFLESKFIFSDPFVIGGCKWDFSAYYRAENSFFFLLKVPNNESLASRWSRQAKFSITIVNQLSDELSLHREAELCRFDEKTRCLGYIKVIPFTNLHAKDGGFLVNDELKIVVEIEVLEVIGELDVSEEDPRPLKKTKLNVDGVVSCDVLKESIDVNGFQVLPSQEESVRRIFEIHPDIAVEFRGKNQHLRTACINVILGLIQTLRKSLQELSCDDLVEADIALTYVKDSGFKVDWLEQKLEEVKIKKKEAQICEARVEQLEKESKEFKQKWSDIEAQLEEEKAKMLASQAHLALDDFY